jgi:hypothetical protein
MGGWKKFKEGEARTPPQPDPGEHRLSGEDIGTLGVIRETILIEHEHGVAVDGEDDFRNDTVGVCEDEVRTWHEDGFTVAKHHRVQQVRYTASDDGSRLERRTRRDDEDV